MPPAAPLPSLPPRTFFLHLSRPLLSRLLAPFAPYLAAPGFPRDSLSTTPPDDPAPVHARFTLLDAAHASPPSPDDPPPPDDAATLLALFERLAAVARAASPAGREALIKIDTERRLPPRFGAEDLAVTAALDFPDLFAAIRVAASADAIKSFVLYRAHPDSDPRFDGPAIGGATSYLSQWFDARHRSAHCDIFVRRRGGEIHFEIAHGKTPATHELIDESLAIKVVTQVTTARSYAIYYEESRVLAVHALEFIKDGIRRSFGHGCGTGADYFAKSALLLDTKPLVDLDAALAPDPALGVTEVELRRIDVMAKDKSFASYFAGKGDVRHTEQDKMLRVALGLEGAYVRYVKLGVEIDGAKRTLLVELDGLRSQLVYDRRDAGVEQKLLAWLAARGIWIGGRTEAVDDVDAVAAQLESDVAPRPAEASA